MNRNGHISTKKDQRRVRDSHNASPEFRVVIFPNHEIHTQPHMTRKNATKKKRR